MIYKNLENFNNLSEFYYFVSIANSNLLKVVILYLDYNNISISWS